jgi:hypothetical protein
MQQLAEHDDGDYRIYASALDDHGGYVAAVVIERMRGRGVPPREAYRDESLAGGYCWPSAQAALRFAMGKGHEMIHARPDRLAC